MYQIFIRQKSWDNQPMLSLLAKQVGTEIGSDDAVIALRRQYSDPTSFPKQGKRSVGVARQWCGRLGKVENCQVAVCMSLASDKGHALVNVRLYMPKEWDRKRMAAAGVPKEHRKFRTRHVTMSLVTSWCLTLETSAQKNDPGDDGSATSRFVGMSADVEVENIRTGGFRQYRLQRDAT